MNQSLLRFNCGYNNSNSHSLPNRVQEWGDFKGGTRKVKPSVEKNDCYQIGGAMKEEAF